VDAIRTSIFLVFFINSLKISRQILQQAKPLNEEFSRTKSLNYEVVIFVYVRIH